MGLWDENLFFHNGSLNFHQPMVEHSIFLILICTNIGFIAQCILKKLAVFWPFEASKFDKSSVARTIAMDWTDFGPLFLTFIFKTEELFNETKNRPQINKQFCWNSSDNCYSWKKKLSEHFMWKYGCSFAFHLRKY